jgi:hypothetical protein
LYDAVRENRQVFHSFRNGDNVGFLIDVAPGRKSMFWTTTGLLDPDPVKFPDRFVDCRFIPDSKAQERSAIGHGCEMGPIEFDHLNHKLVAKYQVVRPRMQLASIPVAGTFNCEPESALCRTELQILYDPPVRDRSPQRAQFSHPSSTIKEASISKGSLWIRDANGQVWRYIVGLEAIRDLVPGRWKGTPPDRAGAHSEACTQLECDKMSVPDWPGAQQESGK